MVETEGSSSRYVIVIVEENHKHCFLAEREKGETLRRHLFWYLCLSAHAYVVGDITG